jgi:hypothetical protein
MFYASPVSAVMQCYMESESAAELLERRWFAALKAARTAQAECDVLLGVKELAEDAWRQTQGRLMELESLRDALGEQLAVLDGPQPGLFWADAKGQREAGKKRPLLVRQR